MKVYLRAFEMEDYKKITRWRKDPEVTKLVVGNKYFISSERDKKWVEEKIFDDRVNIYSAICLKENDEMIGYLAIINIDWRNRKAEWGGITIGDKENQKKGYAKEAAYLMLEYVFEELGLNRFSGYWLESHKPSIQLGLNLGFKKEGIFREYAYKRNKFHNIVILSILKKEYEEFNYHL